MDTSNWTLEMIESYQASLRAAKDRVASEYSFNQLMKELSK